MTKLMMCMACGDIVAPSRKDLDVRYCACRRHAVWWEHGARGILRMHDTAGPIGTPAPGWEMAWVIGLHNGLLTAPAGMVVTSRAHVEAELADTPDTYLFKRANSLVVRIRPGYSNDTGWAPLPLAVGVPE